MVVYVELAFLENFCLDFLLLALTLFATKVPLRMGRLLCSAAVGGVFAVLFPLLSLPFFWRSALKLSVGALLPLLVLGRKKWGIGTLFFFLFTFAFGGALLGFGQRAPKWAKFFFFALLAVLAVFVVQKLYKRRAVFQYVYDCILQVGEKTVRAKGFLDSGNFASQKGLPVCFLTADILYDLVGDKVLFEGKDGGQGCDEMQIFTQAGERKISLYKGELFLVGVTNFSKREVYFAPSTNRIGREYKIILYSHILEGL